MKTHWKGFLITSKHSRCFFFLLRHISLKNEKQFLEETKKLLFKNALLKHIWKYLLTCFICCFLYHHQPIHFIQTPSTTIEKFDNRKKSNQVDEWIEEKIPPRLISISYCFVWHTAIKSKNDSQSCKYNRQLIMFFLCFSFAIERA